MTDTTERNSDLFPEIRAEATRIADAVKSVIEPGRGFICIAFDFAKVAIADGRRASRFGYASNAHRPDVVKALIEFLGSQGVTLPGTIEPMPDGTPRVLPDEDPRQLFVLVAEDMPITCLADQSCRLETEPVTSVRIGKGEPLSAPHEGWGITIRARRVAEPVTEPPTDGGAS